jgi:hypothetical protein
MKIVLVLRKLRAVYMKMLQFCVVQKLKCLARCTNNTGNSESPERRPRLFICKLRKYGVVDRKKGNTESYTNNKDIHSNVWRTALNSKSPMNAATTQPQEFKIPTVINCYATLENQHEENQLQRHNYKKKLVIVKKTKTRTQRRSKTNKALIIGDSYARGLVANLHCEHREFFYVIGIIMPGAGLQIITQAAKNEIRSLNHKNCIIIWGGSYDINKNESSTRLKYIRNFTLQNEHTNIIIPALYRHDLSNSSCVNNEIQVFNRKLSKMTEAMSHVVLLDLAMDRNDFTRHGMHLNLSGKEKVALLIGQHLINLLTKQVNNILPLSWIHDSKDLNSMKEDDVTADMMLLERFPNKVRASERPKKPPVTRTNDFLWEIK